LWGGEPTNSTSLDKPVPESIAACRARSEAQIEAAQIVPLEPVLDPFLCAQDARQSFSLLFQCVKSEPARVHEQSIDEPLVVQFHPQSVFCTRAELGIFRRRMYNVFEEFTDYGALLF
jgi:hypothetical protein